MFAVFEPWTDAEASSDAELSSDVEPSSDAEALDEESVFLAVDSSASAAALLPISSKKLDCVFLTVSLLTKVRSSFVNVCETTLIPCRFSPE